MDFVIQALQCDQVVLLIVRLSLSNEFLIDQTRNIEKTMSIVLIIGSFYVCILMEDIEKNDASVPLIVSY